MAVKDIFKVTRKTFLNPTGWIDYNFIQRQHQYLSSVIRGIFSVPAPDREESFEQAMARLNVNESDIASLIKRYRMYALFFVLCGLITFLYSFFLLFKHGAFFGWLSGMAVAGLFASQAFRFDFWAFQLRSRKLGVSFNEWKESILGK